MKYISVVKPGIIMGNLITLIAGFALGTGENFQPLLLLSTLTGMGLIMASGCVVNNYIDRDIDRLMERTKNRVSVTGEISPAAMLFYALGLLIVGVVILYYLTNALTLLMAILGFVFYVVIYSLWLKRKNGLGTIMGGISGAMPPVVGYVAASNRIDIGMLILFLILFFWQLPHFYAIAIYRGSDYKNAAIPVLPLRRGVAYTRMMMVIYIIAFSISVVLPSLFGYMGYVYFGFALAMSLIWLAVGIFSFNHEQVNAWARKMFLLSIVAIMLISVMMIMRVINI